MGIEGRGARCRRHHVQLADAAGLLGGRKDLEIAVDEAAGRLPGVPAENHGLAPRELDLPRVPAAGVQPGLFGPHPGPGVEGEDPVESPEVRVPVVRELVRPDAVAPGDQDLAAGKQRQPGAEEGRRVYPLGGGPVWVDGGRRNLGERSAPEPLGRVPEGRVAAINGLVRERPPPEHHLAGGQHDGVDGNVGDLEGTARPAADLAWRPGALAGLRKLFGLAAVLRRHLPLLARRQALHCASWAWAARWRACSAACCGPRSVVSVAWIRVSGAFLPAAAGGPPPRWQGSPRGARQATARTYGHPLALTHPPSRRQPSRLPAGRRRIAPPQPRVRRLRPSAGAGGRPDAIPALQAEVDPPQHR